MVGNSRRDAEKISRAAEINFEDENEDENEKSQFDRQPYLMNVPTNTPSEAINSHGLPCISSTIPQLMKKVNSRKTRMARANFIGADCIEFSFVRKLVVGSADGLGSA